MMNNILIWNCRGAGSPKIVYHIVDMIKIYKPSIVALLETRVQSKKMAPILEKSYLTDFIAVEACGFAGGIWLGWEESSVTIEFISHNDQILNVLVKTASGGFWILSVIYAAPNPLFLMEL